MTLTDIIDKTCLIGLSYFNLQEELVKQSQLAGVVVAANEEDGISVQLQSAGADSKGEDGKPAIFILPPSLSCWFHAPKGHFRNPATQVDIRDPDYLVTWDIYQTQDNSQEGQHEWWEWVPRTAPPQVGQPE
ncbi:hypothetical protein G8764_01065 [Pseudomaricurvus alcaniphilus]|uniref:hypothetical protein n=1 Tax=Pseudomaricurvus alcaniphilus TaxID=1166482 RepID=UPI0014079269|nr:hypothetical protein [Pseudomaricurvus alcaniphilus]NHN35881.1 hypothetical protein [Pseudomaricurvus alcaniphilus]